jgi:CMP-N-acetylneuraminic acid synthetase
VPRVLRINAALYLFRSDFVRSRPDSWMAGRHAPLEIPDIRAFHIDGEEDFRMCELLLETHLVEVPWLE